MPSVLRLLVPLTTFLSITTVRGGQLFGFGYNDKGQLAVRETGSLPRPTLVSGPWGDDDVTAVAMGESHTIAIAGGAVYVGGGSTNGQLGASWARNGLQYMSLRRLLDKDASWGNVKVTAVAAGAAHSVVLAGGDIYTFGDNSAGQLGLGAGSATEYDSPQWLNSTRAPWAPKSAVTQIAAGISYTLTVAGDQLYVMGSVGAFNTYTPILLTNTTAPWWPTAVSLVAAGDYHVIVLAGGKVYSFGMGTSGQLGLGSTFSVGTPQVLNNDNAPWGNTTQVTIAAAGGAHSGLVAGDALYMFGDNSFGQLGTGSLTRLASPLLLNNSGVTWTRGSITALAAGQTHTLLLADSIVYAFGWNRYGQLGLGTTDQSLVPRPLLGVPWVPKSTVLIYARYTRSFVIATPPVPSPAPSPQQLVTDSAAIPGPRQCGSLPFPLLMSIFVSVFLLYKMV